VPLARITAKRAYILKNPAEADLIRAVAVISKMLLENRLFAERS
jgi:hypothetical protein